MVAVKERVVDSKQCKLLAFFKELALFTNLLDEEVLHFASAPQVKAFKKGELLYMEDQQADFFYVICSGWLNLYHTTQEGEEVSLAMLTRNSTAGENAVFEQGRFTSSALVAEEAQILSIPLSLLKEQLSVNNHLALNMLAAMVQ